MMTWQPIETAPKDDSAILIFDPKQGICIATNDGEFMDEWYVDGYGLCYEGAGDYAGLRVAYPTHWMPLPTPPESQP